MPRETPKRRSSAVAKVTKAPVDGKKRTKKDGPKRGLSAYMFFSQAHRKQIQEENPEAGFGQIGKLLGLKWKDMSVKEKEPFTAKAEADKQRYENEKAAKA